MTLHLPVRKATREAWSDAAVERMWRAVDGRRRPGHATARPRFLMLATALAVTGLFAVAVLVGFRWRAAQPAETASVDASLRLASGAALEGTLAAAEPSRAFDLSDGSRVELGAGATLQTRANSGAAFDTALRGGTATFDVRPGGPRRWTIDCGVARVEVVGTRFVIDAQPRRVRVDVERGRVRVTGPTGTTELTAGEWIEVVDPTPSPTPTPTPNPDPSPNLDPSPSPSPTPTAASWQDLARRGDYAAAYDTLGGTGIAKATPRASVEELLSLADVARLSGHPEDAVGPLTRVFAENPGDGRAALAAFTLGRIELDTLGHPARAATAFARGIELGLPRGLVEDAYARLVEARAKAGDRDGAAAAFDDYTRAFPGGTRSTTMRRWLGDPNDDRRSSPSPSPAR